MDLLTSPNWACFFRYLYSKGVVIMKKIRYTVLVFVCFFLGFASSAYGLEDAFSQTRESIIEVEMEYLLSIHKDRLLDTTTINILVPSDYFSYEHFSLYYGVTMTYVSGDIIEDGIRYNSTAYGMGPVLLARYEPFKSEKASLSLDFSGALILYNDSFPTGGDFYNFMWRLGPRFSFWVSKNTFLSLSYKWMHVSNGQHTDNPSYDAEGFSIGITKTF